MRGRPYVTYRDAPAVIVGSGAAGLACALAMAPRPVVVLTKTALPESGSSFLAQGGIAAALDPSDGPQHHAADTLSAGAGLSDAGRVDALVRDGVDAVGALLDQGFPADRHADGTLALGREAAHSADRIVHAGGDATGRALVATLLARAVSAPSIEILAATVALDLVVEDGRVTGLLAYGRDCGWVVFRSPAVILATGGAGALWSDTTNPDEATADGIAMAARAGARLADLEFVQFHPTALVPPSKAGDRPMRLLTEALRGAGARLVDRRGRAVMRDEHRLGDLAPRDVVARAIWGRRAAGEPVHLDLRPVILRRGAGAFPQAMESCRAAGYDPEAAPVPVAPAAHYHMGGVLTDSRGRASLDGLWACGEVAATGVHGANRLASNSLLEALVFAQRVASDVTSTSGELSGARPTGHGIALPAVGHAPEVLKTSLRAMMSRHVGLVRQAQGLSWALAALEALQAQFDVPSDRADESGRPAFATIHRWSDLRNMLLAARLIAFAALRRHESRGAHFRSDVPKSRADWAHRQIVTLDDLDATKSRAEAV